MRARLTRRAVAAVALLALPLAGCGEAPPLRLAPTPQPVDSSGGVPLSDDLQAMVLHRLEPLVPALVRRHWGVPPDSVAWRLYLDVHREIGDAPPSCRDTLVVPTPRERTLAIFCRGITTALSPTDTARARGEGTERWLGFHTFLTRHDTIWASVDVGATQRCPDGRSAHAGLSFQYRFVRRAGRWRLVSETPELFGGGSDSTCTPRPMHVWEQPPPGPPPGARPPRRR